MNEKNYKVILIGAGPASLSCAIQLIRANIHDILVISPSIAGLVQHANLIENLLCFPQGITGEKLIQKMIEIWKKYDIQWYEDCVSEINQFSNSFIVKTKHDIFKCDYLVIGTGTIPKEFHFNDQSLLHTHNLIFYNKLDLIDKLEMAIKTKKKISKNSRINQTLGIIGGGDAAFDYALALSSHFKNIFIFQRSKQSKALALLQERVNKQEHIQIIREISINQIKTSEKRVIVDYSNKFQSKSIYQSKNCDYLLIAIGRLPNVSFLSDNLLQIFQICQENSQLSSSVVPNIWFIGDVVNKTYRQIAIAMGDGIKAAMQISENL